MLAELDLEAEGMHLRMRADSPNWVAGPLADARTFEIRRPKELRASVRSLADRLWRCLPVVLSERGSARSPGRTLCSEPAKSERFSGNDPNWGHR